MKKIVIIITPRCPTNGRTYGIRLERRGSIWWQTWAFPFKKERTEYDENAQGSMDLSNMELDGEYPGCPYCQNESLVQCGSCGKIYCYGGESSSRCLWCGNVGQIGYGGWIALPEAVTDVRA